MTQPHSARGAQWLAARWPVGALAGGADKLAAQMNDELLTPVMALLHKRGVALGGLPADQQARVFALVWAGLPDHGMTERQLNEQLKGQLAGAASFLATDHVELRRWLVNAGWLRRDGYGREYQRVPLAAVATASPAGLATAQALGALPVATWARQQRAAHEAQRLARHRAWRQHHEQAAQAEPPPDPRAATP